MDDSKLDADWFERHLPRPGRQTWSGWRGAYRVVTDGQDVEAEDEEAIAPEHGRGHPQLIDDFRMKHPDRTAGRFIAGWLVPTTDNRSYGFLHYGGSVEELEQARRACEAWVGKPVHLLEATGLAGQDWQHPELYASYPEGGALVPPHPQA